MNEATNAAYEAFQMRLKLFFAACEELEVDDEDDELYGAVEPYFKSDLFGVVLRLMSADGNLEGNEVALFNRLFGTDYGLKELKGLHEGLSQVMEGYIDPERSTALSLLEGRDEVLGRVYRNLLLEACSLVAQSDGVEEWAETALIATLREALEG